MSSYFCPICQNLILHHANNRHVYWFCNSCRQEVPLWQENQPNLSLKTSDRFARRA